MRGPESRRAWLGSTWWKENGPHRCNERGPHRCNERGPHRCNEGAPIGATKEATYRCGCRWMRTRRKARSASREVMVEPSHARLTAREGLCTTGVLCTDRRAAEHGSALPCATKESPPRCNQRCPHRCNGGGPNDATKKAPQCGAFFYFDAAPVSASSNRRTRRWTWCSSSCRAGIPLRPFHPSDAAACAGSRSSAAVPVRSAGLRDGYPSG